MGAAERQLPGIRRRCYAVNEWLPNKAGVVSAGVWEPGITVVSDVTVLVEYYLFHLLCPLQMECLFSRQF